jgi:hypothetical protein
MLLGISEIPERTLNLMKKFYKYFLPNSNFSFLEKKLSTWPISKRLLFSRFISILAVLQYEDEMQAYSDSLEEGIYLLEEIFSANLFLSQPDQAPIGLEEILEMTEKDQEEILLICFILQVLSESLLIVKDPVFMISLGPASEVIVNMGMKLKAVS